MLCVYFLGDYFLLIDKKCHIFRLHGRQQTDTVRWNLFGKHGRALNRLKMPFLSGYISKTLSPEIAKYNPSSVAVGKICWPGSTDDCSDDGDDDDDEDEDDPVQSTHPLLYTIYVSGQNSNLKIFLDHRRSRAWGLNPHTTGLLWFNPRPPNRPIPIPLVHTHMTYVLSSGKRQDRPV